MEDAVAMARIRRQPDEDKRSQELLKRTWKKALRSLADRVGHVSFEAYVKTIHPLKLEDRVVTLGVGSPFAREWLLKHYADLIRKALEGALGHALELHFQVTDSGQQTLFEQTDPASRAERGEASPPPPSAAMAVPSRKVPGWIDCVQPYGRFSFENLIVGDANRFAAGVCRAVAARPAATYNPLYIFGSSGLGKTHLLHAIAQVVQRTHPDTQIGFVDGERFTFRYVTAPPDRRYADFRTYTESVGFWLVDDVQLVLHNETTRDEFLQILIALLDSGRQVVIAADRSPNELRGLEERVRSRMEGGLVAEITPPDLETRMAILEKRSRREGWQIPVEVIYFIANGIRRNVRSMEGALTTLAVYSHLTRAPITVALAEEVLGEYLVERPLSATARKGASLESILAVVADAFEVRVEDLRSARREKQILVARQGAMYLARQLTRTTLSEIGKALGGRNHASVKRGADRIETLLQRDTRLQMLIQQAYEHLAR